MCNDYSCETPKNTGNPIFAAIELDLSSADEKVLLTTVPVKPPVQPISFPLQRISDPGPRVIQGNLDDDFWVSN